MKKFLSVLLAGGFIMTCLMNKSFASGATVKKSNILKKAIPDRTVVLTFDDGMMNHYKNVVPELKARGFGGTFYISEISFSAYGTSNYADGVKKGVYMTWDQVKEVADMGFEIGNHSMTHPDLTLMTVDQIKAELKGIEDKCAQYGIAKPTTFAYPGLLYTKKIASALKDMGYTFARSGEMPTYDPLEESPYKVMATDDDGCLNYESFVKQVNKAKDGKVVVLLYHDVPNRSVFAKTMDYLKNNKFNVIAMKDLEEYIDTGKAIQYFDENPEAAMQPTYSAGKTQFTYPGDYHVDTQGKEGFYYMYLDASGNLQYAENMGYYWGPNDPDELFCRISNTLMHPGSSDNPVLKWVAPENGVINIKGRVKKEDRVADDIVFTVSCKDKKLVEHTVTNKSPLDLNISSVEVSKGDRVYFSLVCPTAKGGANTASIKIDFQEKAASAGNSSAVSAVTETSSSGGVKPVASSEQPAVTTSGAARSEAAVQSETEDASASEPIEDVQSEDTPMKVASGESLPDDVTSAISEDSVSDGQEKAGNQSIWIIVGAAAGLVVIAAVITLIVVKKKNRIVK